MNVGCITHMHGSGKAFGRCGGGGALSKRWYRRPMKGIAATLIVAAHLALVPVGAAHAESEPNTPYGDGAAVAAAAQADQSTAGVASTMAPPAPTGLTAVPGDANTKAVLSWTSGGNGGSAITKWQYQQRAYTNTNSSWSWASWGSWSDVCTTGNDSTCPSTTSYTVTGLTAGTAYQFKVRAVNAVGNGPASTESDQVMPTNPGAPGKPQLIPFIDEGAQTYFGLYFLVKWTPPANRSHPLYEIQTVGGSPISESNYSGTAQEGRFLKATTNSSLRRVSHGDPNNPYTYTLRVRARDSHNNLGPWSDTTSAKAALPTVAASNVTSSGATLTVSNLPARWWYKGDQVGATCTAVPNGTNTAALTGLSPGASYTYSVYYRDTCTEDTDKADDWDVKTTFTTLLPAPAGLTATPGDASVTLSWNDLSAPAITRYEYRVNRNDTDTGNFTGWGNWTAIPGSGASTTSHTFTGLTNEKEYRYRLRAVSTHAVGATAPGVAPWHVSATPRDVTLVASSVEATTATLTLSNWSAAWYYKADAAPGNTCQGPVSGGTTTKNLTGLSSNTSYTYTGYSDSGCGTALASASALLTKPGRPTKPSAASGAGSGKLTLTASVTGSGALTKWQYKKKEGVGDFDADWTDIAETSTSLSYAFTGLTDGTSYQFKVRAVNATGDGADSDASDATAPQDETLSAGTPTATTNTLTLAGHTAAWWYKGSQSGAQCVSVAANTATVSLSGLSPSTQYTYKAHSATGCGSASLLATASAFTTATPSLAASAVEDDTATLTLSGWVAGTGNGKDGNWWLKRTTPSDTTCKPKGATVTESLSSLSSNTSYAYKAYSDSTCSTELASEAFLTKPGKPTKPSAVSGAGSGTLTLTASVTGNGALSKWQYKKKAGAGNFEATWTDISSTSTSLDHDVAGLTDGTSYQFKVRAVNATGDGADSDASAAATPQAWSLTAGTPTATTNTLTLTGHTAAWWYKGSQNGAQCLSVAANTNTASLSGLSPNTSYTYKAYGASGCNSTSLQATASAFTTASPSLSSSAVADDTATLTLSGWVAGTGNGKDGDWWLKRTVPSDTTCKSKGATAAESLSDLSPNTPYTYKAYSDSDCSTELAFEAFLTLKLTATALSHNFATLTLDNHSGIWHYKANQAPDNVCKGPVSTGTKSLTGLTPGASYTFKAYSDSSCITELASASPFTLADAPLLRVRDVSQTTATLNLSNGPQSWRYMANKGPDTPCTLVDSSTEVSLTGLSSNTSYTYTAYSGSSCSNVLASESFLTKPGKPGKPSKPVAASGAGSGTLTLTASVTGNRTLTKWQYKQKASSDAAFGSWQNISLTSTSLDHDVTTGLTDGTSYQFKVRAVNATGNGADSDASDAATPADETLTASSLTHNSATLTIGNHSGGWHYKADAAPDASCSSQAVTGTTVNLMGLSSNTSYTYKAYSDSTCSTLLASESLLTKPGKPSGLSVTSNLGSGKLKLSGASVTGNRTVTKWQYVKKAGTNDFETTWTDITPNSATLDHTVSSLTDGTSYRFKVRAVNATGNGLESDESTAKSPRAETLTASSLTHNSATLSLTGHTTAWWYKGSQNGAQCVLVEANTNTASLSLQPGTTYTYTAYSDSGCSTVLASETFTTASSPSNPGQTPSTASSGGGSGGSRSALADPIRLGGDDRYHTAALVAQEYLRDRRRESPSVRVNTVIVASGENFPDALAAAPLARRHNAPVLLTTRNVLHERTKAFLEANTSVIKVYLLGGVEAISAAVEAELKGMGYRPIRVDGGTRYETAVEVAKAAGAAGHWCATTKPTALLVSGENWRDALTVAPVAYRGQHPLLLTRGAALPEAVSDYLSAGNVERVVIVGDTDAVSVEVAEAVAAAGVEVERIFGDDAAYTARDVAIAAARPANYRGTVAGCLGDQSGRVTQAGLVTDAKFPDALAAGPLLGQHGAPVLFVSPDNVPTGTRSYVVGVHFEPNSYTPPFIVVGGIAAVPKAHVDRLLRLAD